MREYDFDFYYMNEEQIDRLNSATKYPSIETYHALGEKGRLKEEVTVSFEDGEDVFVTEKIDGTNARIIVDGKGNFIVGSREDLLWASRDLIFNPAMHIVSTLRPVIQDIGGLCSMRGVLTIYGEVYGVGVGAAHKNYATSSRGFRVFDIMEIEDIDAVLSMPKDRISANRSSIQKFLSQRALMDDCERLGLSRVPPMSRLSPPKTVGDTYEWMSKIIRKTCAGLDKDIDEKYGNAEGLVVRNRDRSKIVKIRFEDYRRTLK